MWKDISSKMLHFFCTLLIWGIFHIAATNAQMTISNTSIINFNSSVVQGQFITFSRTITLSPSGVLDNFTVYFEMSSDLPAIPLMITSATFNGSLHLSNSSCASQNVSSNCWTESFNGTDQIFSVAFSTITNTQAYAAVNCSVTVSFLVTAVDAKGMLNTSVSLLYGNQNLAVSSVTSNYSSAFLHIATTYTAVNIGPPVTLKVSTSVSHSINTPFTAYDVTMEAGSPYWEINFPTLQNITELQADNYQVANDRLITWNKATLPALRTMTLSYETFPDVTTLPSGVSYHNASIYWTSISGGILTGLITSFCIERQELQTTTYSYGFTVLALLVSIVVGFILVLVVAFVIWKVRNVFVLDLIFSKSSAPLGDKGTDKNAKAKQKALIVNANLLTDVQAATKFGAQKGSASDDSMVGILVMSDQTSQRREITHQDISKAVELEESIENDRSKAALRVTLMVVASLCRNGDLNKNWEEQCRNKFLKNISLAEKEYSDDYKRQMTDLYKRLGAKNKSKLEDVNTKQQAEQDSLLERLKGLPKETKDEMLGDLSETHKLENEALQHLLQLEQDEEAERIRKDLVTRKQMTVKTYESQYLDEITTGGQLPRKVVDWLLREHQQNQAELNRVFDQEIARQQMALEEKLARRKALVDMMKDHEEEDSQVLNILAGHNMDIIKKAKKTSSISTAVAKGMLKEVTEQMATIKEQLEKDKKQQQDNLQKKLSEKKKKALELLKKRQSNELTEFEKTISTSSQTEIINPQELATEFQKVVSKHRSEVMELENESDRDHAQELLTARRQISEKAQTDLLNIRDKLKIKLQNSMKEDTLNRILHKYDQEVEELKQQQAENQNQQEENFEKRLRKRRQQLDQQRQSAEEDELAFRELQDKMVKQLMNSQAALTPEEKKRILDEHQRHSIQLGNNLALNKLRQSRSLEEKVALKKAQKLERIQKKELLAMKKMKATQRATSGDEEDSRDKELEVLQQFAALRLETLQSESPDTDKDMEEIQEEMMRERAAALKEQEVRLSAIIQEMEMDRQRQLAAIEDQQTAIARLQSNLLDELNERKTITDSDCQQVLERHKKDIENLSEQLERNRDENEVKLKQRLEKRVEAQRRLLQQQQADEDKVLLQSASHSLAGKLKRAALMEKHKLALEDFRKEMEVDCRQMLEDARRKSELQQTQQILEEDMKFINTLVRLGKFSRNELQNVLQLLFPTQTEEENNIMLDKLGVQQPLKDLAKDAKIAPPPLRRQLSSLEARVQKTRLPIQEDTKPSLKSTARKKQTSATSLHHNYEDQNFSDEDMIAPESFQQFKKKPSKVPPSKLPPLSEPKMAASKRRGQQRVYPDDQDEF